jgi:hypothetical protein
MRPGSDTVATLTPYAIADAMDARAGVSEILRASTRTHSRVSHARAVEVERERDVPEMSPRR